MVLQPLVLEYEGTVKVALRNLSHRLSLAVQIQLMHCLFASAFQNLDLQETTIHAVN
jgi:hypothetical protein